MSLDPAGNECSISHTFRHVYRFILEAMKGDTAAASAIFEKYLGGELPEELISLSRCHVQENQNQSRGTRGAAVRLANGSGKERKPPPDDPYGNFLGDCYG
jgi:hypothetical protein